jgi:ATP diphosphatase
MSIYKVAYDISKKAAEEGFDWKHWTGAYQKVEEELSEVRQEAVIFKGEPHKDMIEEFGDLLLSVMTLARHLRIDPEKACQIGVQKFATRFDEYKKYTNAKGMDIKTADQQTLSDMWDEYKESVNPNPKSGAIGED